MKTKSKASSYVIRGGAFAILLLSALVTLTSAFNPPTRWTKSGAPVRSSGKAPTASRQTRKLTFGDRVAYQRAIEDVYWRHRIWPQQRTDPKPSLDEVMPPAQLEKKVKDYLRDSHALEDHWQQPLSVEQLQAEMERMAQQTKQPEVLRELFEALGNDPFVVAECLARQVLTERSIADVSVQDKTRRFRSGRAKGLRTMSAATTLGDVAYSLPKISEADTPCTNNTWTATSTINQAPSGREWHTAVWTGSEMIVWGGYAGLNPPEQNTGGRYSPAIDSWTATSTTDAPTPRLNHTAVWTGSEMIVWGGYDDTSYFNTLGIYNPITDNWAPTSTLGAPDARSNHTAVWTGSEMIVWGGCDDLTCFNTGGKFNPIAESWTAMSTTDAPTPRFYHTAVWTGSEMIVWGGEIGPDTYSNTGGKYDPSTDSWGATSTINAPSSRESHTAVWTGSEMIVWGGFDGTNVLNTGGRYNPTTDSWLATSTINAPPPREHPTAVWTGSEMIVWGGFDRTNDVNTGGRYNPGTNSWATTNTIGAPEGRVYHTAVWSGSEMIVWGGYADSVTPPEQNTGGRYCAAAATPTPTASPTPTPTPTPTATHTATATPTPTPTATHTATPTPTPTPTSTPGGTLSPPIAHAATSIASNSFTANWSDVSGATGYRLDVSTSSSFNTYVTGYQNLNVGNATSRGVTGLNVSTTYYCRVRAYNGAGTSGNSNVINVTTLSASGPPVVVTNPATLIASFSATLNGSVDPHGLTTFVYFEYGTTTSYGHTTALQTQTGNTFRNISANISGLNASATYHFRIVAMNSSGTVHGSDTTFTTLSATGLPVVITNPATLIASFSATLNGSVDPHGHSTTVHFEYGTTTSYGQTTANQTKTGNTYQSVAANISGLAASTTYHFRIVAMNSSGTVHGSDTTFTTLSTTGPPVVITNPATLIASFSATLNGSVDPHGLTTNVHFEYGTTTSYGLTTADQSKSGNTYQSVAANISGLAANTTYHFRIVASNSMGTVHGSDRTFTTLSATGPPVVITNPATNVTTSSAALNGSVDPHGLSTSVHFQYGTTTGYGSTTPSQTKTGNTYQNVPASISGLSAGTTYHFRIVASNSDGISNGADRTFTTP
jgi:N-acetylneuraminic acid mutarotase